MYKGKIKKKKKIIDRLSPHLKVYRPELTSLLSIYHRITGVLLVAILSMSCWTYRWSGTAWFKYDEFSDSKFYFSLLKEPMIEAFMLIIVLSFVFHTLNGMRHLLWDAGFGLEINEVYKSGTAVIVFSLLLSVLIWVSWF